jgi:hypothetical protein
MDDAKLRVEQELKELGEKMSKLVNFTCSEKFRNLTNEMQYLMCDQLRTMMEYGNILRRRLQIWDKPEAELKHSICGN